MKLAKSAVISLAALLAIAASGPVLAGGGYGGGHFSYSYGRGGHYGGYGGHYGGYGGHYGGYGGYYGYYRPYYPYSYYPPIVVVPSATPVYIEQGNAQAAPEPSRAQASWYYCVDAEAYYPYVKQCPGGWQRVAPQPPPN